MKNGRVLLVGLVLGLGCSAAAFADGNVVVEVSGDTLFLVGDQYSNRVAVSDKDEDGRWEVVGDGSTKLNGLFAPVTTAVPTDNVRIDLGDRDDNVKFSDAAVPGTLTVWMGAGNDKAMIYDTTIGQSLLFEGNDGDDKLSIKNMTVEYYYSRIEMDDGLSLGKDSLKMKGFSGRGLDVTLGSGVDKCTVQDSTLTVLDFGFLTILAGGDRDRVNLKSVTAYSLTAEMEDGDGDGLKVSGCTSSETTFDGGAGTGDRLLLGADNTLGSGTPVNFEP